MVCVSAVECRHWGRTQSCLQTCSKSRVRKEGGGSGMVSCVLVAGGWVWISTWSSLKPVE